MTRRSSRIHETSSPASAPQKRANPATGSPAVRQSKRVKSNEGTPRSNTKSTPKKSEYFKEESDSQSDDDASQFEDEAEDASSDAAGESESVDIDVSSDDDDVKPNKKPSGRKGKELWRSNVKAGLGSGKQVIVKLPKPREAGNIAYRNDRIHPNTFLFLQDLAANNDRDWLKLHDVDFRQSEKDFDSFVDELTQKLIEKDDTIPELPVKDLKFRIYRDIRFSPDPTPYKPYFSAAWSRTGRKGPYAAYYVQVQPGSSFVGGGLWHPDAQPLALIRRDIDRKSHKLKRVLLNPNIRRDFLGKVADDERKAVKAFIEHNKDNILKTKPKGFDASNPNIDLLRLRNFVIGKKLGDQEVVGAKGLQNITNMLASMTPFIHYLNSVVMPDNSSSDDESQEEDGDEDEQVDSDEGDTS
ncbi:MAG: hypothetical protein M1825_002387 [Sarcosagium campestre]|nr:MAG: hypothetical protein M1825_002387 [Sarcosagium campestre]